LRFDEIFLMMKGELAKPLQQVLLLKLQMLVTSTLEIEAMEVLRSLSVLVKLMTIVFLAGRCVEVGEMNEVQYLEFLESDLSERGLL